MLRPAASRGQEADSLSALLERNRRKHDVPALGVALVRSTGLEHSAAAGVRKRGSDVPATLDDQWHLGSDTKPMTAFLIALLVEMGLLSWDDALADIFPEVAREMPEAARKITVRQLATHHSGLPANWPLAWRFKGSLPEQRLELVSKLKDLKRVAEPGARFNYSNVGYTLLGAVAERRGKKAYETLMAEHLFRPLKMKDVGWGPMGTPDAIEQPWPHNEDGAAVKPTASSDNVEVMNSAGRLHAPLQAWSCFAAEALRGARKEKGLLPAAAAASLFAPPFKDRTITLGGWLRQEIKSKKAPGVFFAHDGSNTLNYCTMVLLPESDIAVLVTCNQGGRRGQAACQDAREEALLWWLGRAKAKER